MTRRRERAVAVAAAVAGGLLLVLASGRPWVHYVVSPPPPLPERSGSLSGRDLSAVPLALGALGVAGAVAVLATRRLGRVVVGAVLVLAGILAAVASATALHDRDTALAEKTATETRVEGAGTTSTTTGWWVVSLAGGAVVAAAGGWIAVRGRRWPGMGERYDAPRAARPPADPAVAAWDALDRGDDPTA